MDNILINPFTKFDKEWALVTAGNKDHFNSMTISWGSMGTLWSKSVITIYVRPERYTDSFLKDSEYFTVSFFKAEYRNALGIMGTKSGRDIDKVKVTGLTPLFIEDNAITYKEAYETYLCKKIYTQKLNKEDFPSDVLHIYGENGLPHNMYVGEVIKKL